MSYVTSWYNEKGLSGNRDTLFTAIFMEYDDKTLDFSGYKYYKPKNDKRIHIQLYIII